MNKMGQKTKIVTLCVAIIMIIGILVTITVGLNFDLRYQEAKNIQLYLAQEFEISDIEQITKETLQNQTVVIQKVEVFEDSVSILAKEITEEQKNNLISKMNEKYGTELSVDNIEIVTIPHTRGRDIIKPYVMPFTIATVIILVYMAIRYYKLGIIQTVGKTALCLVITQMVLLSAIAIVRIPIGRVTIPLVLVVYLSSLLGITIYFEKQLKEKKEK